MDRHCRLVGRILCDRTFSADRNDSMVGWVVSRRDNAIHAQLTNWAKAQNVSFSRMGIPRRQPKGSSWAQDIVNPGDTIASETYIDEDCAELTNNAVLRLAKNNNKAAGVLRKHYRDGVSMTERKARHARNMLWKYL